MALEYWGQNTRQAVLWGAGRGLSNYMERRYNVFKFADNYCAGPGQALLFCSWQSNSPSYEPC